MESIVNLISPLAVYLANGLNQLSSTDLRYILENVDKILKDRQNFVNHIITPNTVPIVDHVIVPIIEQDDIPQNVVQTVAEQDDAPIVQTVEQDVAPIVEQDITEKNVAPSIVEQDVIIEQINNPLTYAIVVGNDNIIDNNGVENNVTIANSDQDKYITDLENQIIKQQKELIPLLQNELQKKTISYWNKHKIQAIIDEWNKKNLTFVLHMNDRSVKENQFFLLEYETQSAYNKIKDDIRELNSYSYKE